MSRDKESANSAGTAVKKICGTEIGEMMGVDYGTVSQGRKRLREKLITDKHLSQIIKRVEVDLSIINRLSENSISQ